MIVKVQTSLFPPGGGECLVYDRERKFEYHGPTTPDIREAMRGRPKAYFEVELEEDGAVFVLGKEVPAQPW